MNVGTLRERVTIQARVSGVDALGQESIQWQDVATVWAAVDPLAGREYFAAGQMQAPTDMRVTIRWRFDASNINRLLWKGQLLEVISVIDRGARIRFLELMCASGIRNARVATEEQQAIASTGLFLDNGLGVYTDAGEGVFLET